MPENRQIPVYLFTGFLEGGKTKFIQETLEDGRFNKGEPTLLLVCEEGIEEYAPEQFSGHRVKLKAVENEADLTPENLVQWLAKAEAERVLVEYNGMWMLDSLYGALPEGWLVAQEFMFADANTFLSYNANMRQLTYDKLKSAELVVFNRFKSDMDKMEFHKIVRAASRRAAPRKRRRGNAGGEGETRAAGKEKPQRAAAPAEAGRKKRSEAGESKARPAARSSKKHRGGPRGPIEPMKSNRTKDSTEQHSLMKPYYLDN